MRKFFKSIHLWLSVPFGVIISIICFSGAMLVFESEITGLFRRHAYHTENSGETIPIDSVISIVEPHLAAGVEITGVTIYPDPDRTYQVSISKPRRASAYVDQYSGEFLGIYERPQFFSVMIRMHRWLLDSASQGGGIFWGKLIVGIATIVFVFVLITGVIVWWPKTSKALKNKLGIHAGKGWWRFWYDLHCAGGVYVVIFLLAMALTGLTWSFPWYRTAFYKVFGVEMQQNRQGGSNRGGGHGGNSESVEEKETAPYAVWDEVYEQLSKDNPKHSRISLSEGRASVYSFHFGNSRASDTYSFDPASGEIIPVSLYEDASRSSKVRSWVFSVHTGAWGGLVTRILTFIAALVGASLPVTGYYLWIKRLVRKRKSIE